MKFYSAVSLAFVGALVASGINGCATDDNSSSNYGSAGLTGNIKTQGIYTTIAIQDMPLDMPASGYMQKSLFAPGETPGAVVVGYGAYGQPQAFTLQLMESDTGRTLLSQDSYDNYQMAWMLPLHIRLSGNYELKLSANGSPLDSWQFAVSRTNAAGVLQIDRADSTASYGEGQFSIFVGPENLPDYLSAYDDKLIYSMVNAITENAGAFTNEDLFAQRFPGKVVVHCRLDASGNLTNLKVLENTMDNDCAALFQEALLKRSPYDAWPPDFRQKWGSDYRDLTLTVHFD